MAAFLWTVIPIGLSALTLALGVAVTSPCTSFDGPATLLFLFAVFGGPLWWVGAGVVAGGLLVSGRPGASGIFWGMGIGFLVWTPTFLGVAYVAIGSSIGVEC